MHAVQMKLTMATATQSMMQIVYFFKANENKRGKGEKKMAGKLKFQTCIFFFILASCSDDK